jgi:hypothetical protein
MKKYYSLFLQLSWITKASICISFCLLVLSLSQDAFYIDSPEGHPKAYADSSFLFFLGWMSFLGGGLVPFIIWLANPLYFLTIIFTVRHDKSALFLSLTPIILASVFMMLPSILTSESGSTSEITSRGLGFYLWFSAFIVLFFGVFIGQKQQAST